MAHAGFEVEVLAPEGEVWSGEVEMVSTRTSVGSIGLLANHEPVLAILEPVELRLYEPGGDVRRYAQGEGYLQVTGNRALLLVEDAVPPEELDAADLREKLRRAEQDLESAEADTEEQRTAARVKHRWETFLAIAEGGTES